MNAQDIQTFFDEYAALTNRVAAISRTMAARLVGRLRHADKYVLRRLKRELQDFDAHKGCWN